METAKKDLGRVSKSVKSASGPGVNPPNELTPEQPDGIGVIKNVVCRYCQNKLRQGCIEECAPEGLYRNLEPMELDLWHDPPKLPRMAKFLEYGPVTRLALMYLVLHYVLPCE